MNSGHGHVRPRPDGMKARCGGPSMCKVCAEEQIALNRAFEMLKTPYERAAAEHARQRGPRSFTEDVELHLLNGFVFSTPRFFIMGRAVPRHAPASTIVDPNVDFSKSKQWVSDCWHVYLMAGDVGAAWSILPWPLPWLSWERQRGQELELCFYRSDAIRRLSPPPSP